MKECSKCLESKDESEFYKDTKLKCGLDSWCKQCRKDNTYKIRKENPGLRKQYEENWVNNNKVKLKIHRRNHYVNNKEKEDNQSKEWRANNSEHVKTRDNLYRKKQRKTDPLYRLKTNMRSMLSRVFKRKGYAKDSHAEELLGCSFEDLLKHMGPKPEGDIDVDHICPCAQAQDESELEKLQHHSNLKWMEAEGNLYKSDNWTPEGEELCRKLLKREWKYKENTMGFNFDSVPKEHDDIFEDDEEEDDYLSDWNDDDY